MPETAVDANIVIPIHIIEPFQFEFVISYHCFADGTMMEIRYKDKNGVMVVKYY